MQFSKKAILLDLETTGLKREHDQIISIGMRYLDEMGSLMTTHFFLENPDEEQHLLTQFLDFIQDFDTLYSYYGKGFEFPFLLSRLEHHHLDCSGFLRLKLIDLKNVLKHFGKNRQQLEQLFHYTRHCQSTGYDIVKLYRTYSSTPAEIYKRCILEHQKEELASLHLFWELYMTLYDSPKWQLVTEQSAHNRLELTLKSATTFSTSFKGEAHHMTFSYTPNESLIHVTLPMYEGTLHHRLEPLRDYYYIDSQKQLLHKSLAQFMPASLKRKATKEECVVSKASRFIQLVTDYKMNVPLWHHPEGLLYIEDKDFSADILGIQLFNLFFQNRSKGGRA